MAFTTEQALRKVRALLDKAEDSAVTPAEAELYRSKAEQLMRDYRIEQEAALAKDPQSAKPELRTIILCDMHSEFYNQYWGLMYRIADHSGLRVKHAWTPEGLVAQAVGYDIDLRLAEMLYTNARMAFSEYLEPKPEPALSDQENCYRMRRAGMERNRIAKLLWGSAMDDGQAHGKVAKLYKAECAARGEDATLSGRGVNAKEYRKQYADGFVTRMARRLKMAREGADKLGGLPGGLHGREERVNEEFYRLFPELRPGTAVAQQKACEACKKISAKIPGKKCRKHTFRWTAADEAAERRRNSATALAGRAAGAAAADTVVIDGSEPAARLDRYTADERENTREIWAALGQ